MIGTAQLAGGAVLLADNDTDKGSPLGLFLLLLIAVAVYFLWRSMNRHVKKLPESFDAPVLPEPSDPRIIVADQVATQAIVTEAEPDPAAVRSPGSDEPDRP